MRLLFLLFIAVFGSLNIETRNPTSKSPSSPAPTRVPTQSPTCLPTPAPMKPLNVTLEACMIKYCS